MARAVKPANLLKSAKANLSRALSFQVYFDIDFVQLSIFSESHNTWIKNFSTGRIHPQVATALNNIAGVLESKGDYASALKMYDEALAIFMKSFRPDHSTTKTVQENRRQAYERSLQK